MTYVLSIEPDGELAFVLSKEGSSGRRRVLFLIGDGCNGAGENQSDAEGERKPGPSPGNCFYHGIPLRSGLRNAHKTRGEEISEDYSSEGQSRIWFFDDKVCFTTTCRDNAAAENFRDDLRGIAGAVHPKVSELIRR
jgi:hypothetical protein